MNMRNGLSLTSACWLAIMLGGCGGLLTSDRPAATTWWLEPLAPASDATAYPGGEDLSLEVSVVPGLDTDRILTLSPDNQLSHLASARWADNLPDVLDSVLSRSFGAGVRETSGAAKGARGESCRVALEFHEFFARLGRAQDVQSVQLSLSVEMQCGSGATSSNRREVAAVSGDAMAGVVAAFQQGLNRVTQVLRTDLYNLANSGANSGSE